MKRILVIGSAGSGKTFFSDKLSQKLKIEVLHLDSKYWKKDFTHPDLDLWVDFMEKAVLREKWIMDGNYIKTLNLRLERADTVVFLDVSRLTCFFSLIKRIIFFHGKNRPDMGEECYERFDIGFLKWAWNFKKLYKPRLLEELKKYPNINVLVFKSRKAAYKYFNIK